MDFPATLPRCSQQYSSESNPFLVTNEFEVNSRQRRKYSNTEEKIQVRWLFSQLQFDIFKKFHKDSLGQGAGAFNLDVIGLDGLKNLSVQIIGGKFAASYTGHRHYQVSCNLIVLTSPVMSGDVFDFLLSDMGANPDLFNLAALVLSTYEEAVYGDSQANEITDNFLLTYS